MLTPATVVLNLENGLIDEIRQPSEAADLVAPPTCAVLPGRIETHVHFRESKDGRGIRKEDFRTGGRAAINGGIVHACEMGNNEIIPCDEVSYGDKDDLAQKSDIPITLYATVVKGSRPFTYKRRRIPFKVFMGPSIGNSNFETNAECADTIRHYEGEDMSSHCEDPHILREYANKPTHEERRPNHAETTSIEFAIDCALGYHIKRWKVCHVSTKEGKRLITEARRAGVRMVAEGTHHHAWFNTDMLTDLNRKMLQMNPPIRSPEDQRAILEGLFDGTIHILAGDHAPHLNEEKNKGTSGVTEADTDGAYITHLIRNCGFSLARIVQACCVNPARFVNEFLPPEFGLGYGFIEPGCVASLTILDLDHPVIVTKDKLLTKCGHSPFEGVTFPGCVWRTIVRGVVHEPIMC